MRLSITPHSFSSGDRVIVDEKHSGTIIDIFPDGIHMVRLDEGGRMIAAMASQLKRIEPGEERRESAARGAKHDAGRHRADVS